MTTRELTPAEFVIYRFGGVGKLARALNLHRSTISKWKGMEGIPSPWLRPILEKAKSTGMDITANDLIMGRAVETRMVEVLA